MNLATLARLFGRRRRQNDRPATLFVMRFSDMMRVHPQMTTDRVCSQCGEQVGIYPSGQRILRQYPNAAIICNRCGLPHGAALAPGAGEEPFESQWR